jgi:hypothetical protein
MKKNVLVVGLTPEYYSSPVREAVSSYQATMRSTNMGASFITRSIVSIFDATYVDIASDYDISQLRNDHDVCVVSLASHLGPSRDVSMLVRFLKKLDIKTVFLSGGLDAGQEGTDGVSASIFELIELCSSENRWVGVRGAASALYLHRQGLKNVVPIGCPTMYSKYSGPLETPSIESCADIAVPFHWSIAASLLDELSEHRLIGQDCIDEEIFLDMKGSRIAGNISERLGVAHKEVLHKLERAISNKGYFPDSYEAWYESIGAQKALLSGRLHAAICGLTQGVPTVLTSWDMRTKEIIDYFQIPSVSANVIQNQGSILALSSTGFEKFNERQEVVWARWSEFLRLSDLRSVISGPNSNNRINVDWEKSLISDNELLSTASCLQPQVQDGHLQFINRAFRFINRRSKKILASYWSE